MLCLKYCRAAASAWATPKTKATAAESIAGAATTAAAATASVATNH